MTALPTISDFTAAVQSATSFTETYLAEGQLVRNRMGLPLSYAGNFAVVYRLSTERGEMAVKCYWRELPRQRERLRLIGQRLRALNSSQLTRYDYLERCLLVGPELRPAVIMPWVVGSDLRTTLEGQRDPEFVLKLRSSLRRLISTLTRAGIAHGDMQHGNLLVRPDGTIVAVDYDMMYVPGAKAFGSAGLGNDNYQHPGRSHSYDARLDSTPALLLDLALSALAVQPALWDTYSVEDGVLFSQEDLIAPRESPLFRSLLSSSELGPQAERLVKCCENAYSRQPLVTYTARQQENVDRVLDSVPVVAAADGAALLRLANKRVRVVGKVESVRFVRRGRSPKAFLDFGASKYGGFIGRVLSVGGKLVISEDVLTGTRGMQVEIEGTVGVHESPGWPATPEMDIHSVDALRVLTEEELSAPAVVSALQAVALHTPRQRARALHDLYRGR